MTASDSSRPAPAAGETAMVGIVRAMAAGLGTQTGEISSIAELINSISLQTNLLALNAAIESAHAGEKGRGFAVVAKEVRQLALSTTQAAANIGKLATAIRDEVANAMTNVLKVEQLTVANTAANIAAHEAQKLQLRFSMVLGSIQCLKQSIEGLDERGLGPSREQVSAVMAEYLRSRKELLAYSCCCEPNAIGGTDADNAGRPGNTPSGRFIPYWNRASGRVELELLADYDVPGKNDWYEIPRKCGRPVLMEPYVYMVNGEPTLMTSLMTVLKIKNRFAGVIGADFGLGELQTELSAARAASSGELMVLSNGGLYVTHPDIGHVGKAARDIPAEAMNAVRRGEAHCEISRHSVRAFHPIGLENGIEPWCVIVQFTV